jgi:hypothetical protein
MECSAHPLIPHFLMLEMVVIPEMPLSLNHLWLLAQNVLF